MIEQLPTPILFNPPQVIRDVSYFERVIEATIIVLTFYYFCAWIKREYRKWKKEA